MFIYANEFGLEFKMESITLLLAILTLVVTFALNCCIIWFLPIRTARVSVIASQHVDLFKEDLINQIPFAYKQITYVSSNKCVMGSDTLFSVLDEFRIKFQYYQFINKRYYNRVMICLNSLVGNIPKSGEILELDDYNKQMKLVGDDLLRLYKLIARKYRI